MKEKAPTEAEKGLLGNNRITKGNHMIKYSLPNPLSVEVKVLTYEA